MGEFAKKDMVDFLYKHVRIKGQHFTKARLKQCSEGTLLKIIRCKPEIEKDFLDYLHALREETEAKQLRKQQNITVSDEELVRKIEEWVNVIAQKEWTITPTEEFRPFLYSIPFGTISDEKLMQLTEKILNVDLNVSYLLLEYSIAQEKVAK